MSKTPSFLIGCDPEFFVVDKDKNLVAAAGLIPGDKDNPHPVEGGGIQVDGLAVEIGTNPTASFEIFNDNFVSVVSALSNRLKESGHKILITPSVEFDKDYYDSVVPKEAKVLGCNPDYNAYTGEMNTPPTSDSPARGAAGHIHIGWGKDIPVDHPDHLEICREFVKCLDFWVGLGLTMIETDTNRRKMYGAAGAFRPKSYGVEYRVPSNEWCKSKARRKFMWQLVQQAINDMKRSRPYFITYGNVGNTRKAIDNADQALARSILSNVISFSYDFAIPK